MGAKKWGRDQRFPLVGTKNWERDQSTPVEVEPSKDQRARRSGQDRGVDPSGEPMHAYDRGHFLGFGHKMSIPIFSGILEDYSPWTKSSKVFFKVNGFESVFSVNDYVNVGDDGNCKETLMIQSCTEYMHNLVS